MNAKKTISKFIAPNWIPAIICLLIPGVNVFSLFFILGRALPAQLRANKVLKKLEAEGKLEQAAAEITSSDSKRFMNGKVVLSANHVFCRRTGYVFGYDELVWAYKHTFTYSILFIPVVRIDSLTIASKTTYPKQVVSMGKDKTNEIANAIAEIYRHNQSCLIGFNKDIQAQYNALAKK